MNFSEKVSKNSSLHFSINTYLGSAIHCHRSWTHLCGQNRVSALIGPHIVLGKDEH